MNNRLNLGASGKLFLGKVADEQRIESERPSRHLLLPDSKSRYRLATTSEANRIFKNMDYLLLRRRMKVDSY